MKNYKELEVWQKSKKLTIDVYKATEAFPHAEQFGLTSQIRRAAVSVTANIAEGWGRGSTREYVRCLLIARGSLMELDTHLIIADELTYLQSRHASAFQAQIESVGQMLNRLIQALRVRRPTPRTTAVPVSENESRTPNPESRDAWLLSSTFVLWLQW
jgi:four helix bundle protein